MLNIAFASPWLLGFLAVLPALWWLLRLIPPAPKKIPFPALALLKDLTAREETPTRTPWWLLLLRLAIAALLITGFAKPLLDPMPVIAQKGALLIAIDNDWATARDWAERQNNLRDMLRTAMHDKRPVFVLTTAPDANDETPRLAGPIAAEAALADINRLTPKPWSPDWNHATASLQNLENANITDVTWLASGIGSTDAKIFYDALQKITPVKIFGTATPIYTLATPVNTDDAMSITVRRAATETEATATLNAVAKTGAILARWPAHFMNGAPSVAVKLDIPPELRNRIARFEIDTPRTAATTLLLDAAWEHRAVGIVGDAAELNRHSLLSEIFYIDRALKPFADIHIDTLDTLIKANLPIIILTDTAAVTDDAKTALTTWIKHGGILIRFAGERFAGSDHAKETDLLPVPLRAGNRSLNGAMSWGKQQKLEAFPPTSPFHNLAIPDDVTVSRQILAEPSPGLSAKTWASLTDGTPLVTAAPIGQGLSILFHVPAQSSWSNLPLSGLFVEMLQKILPLSQNTNAANLTQPTSLPPLSLLDAFGEEQIPASTALPIPSDAAASTPITPQHPPGLYGTETSSLALNLGPSIGQPEILRGVPIENYTPANHEINLQPYLLVAAFVLLLGDFFLSLRLRGFLKIAALLFAITTGIQPAQAADDKTGIELTSATYLAYVRTGDNNTDRTSDLGLHGLATALERRTSIDKIGVAGVDPNSDDLAFFPLLYWPIVPDEHPLSREGAARVTHYLRHGGMILFDAASGETAGPAFLRQVLTGVDLPPLIHLPDTHVLKRTFYRLDNFPGRFAGRNVWLEPEEASAYDGVASVVYGSNGWAAAWAIDNTGHALYPCMPDGEPQRERAFRFGVNLVIYALTGNYKNDQLQTSALLEKMKK